MADLGILRRSQKRVVADRAAAALRAAVQELEDSVMCVFILQLIGDDESIDKAEAEIDKNGVLRERLEVE